MGGLCTKEEKVDAKEDEGEEIETKNAEGEESEKVEKKEKKGMKEKKSAVKNALDLNADLGAKKTAVDFWVNATLQKKGSNTVYSSFDKDAYLGYNIVQFVSAFSNVPAPTLDKSDSLDNDIIAVRYANEALHMKKSEIDIIETATLINAKDDTRTTSFYWDMFLSTQQYVTMLQSHRTVYPQAVTEIGRGVNAAVLNDWSDLLTYTPQVLMQPTSWENAENLVLAIWPKVGPGKQLSSIRVLGSLHSCAPIWEGEATLDLSRVPNDPLQWVDDYTVIADANYTLHQFLIDVALKGKTLPATGGTDEQTLAGLISTNTAPATSTVTMYTGFQSITFMTVVNNAIAYNTIQSSDQEAWNNAICSLGALGIIRKVQVKLIDNIFFKTVQKIALLDDMLADLDVTTAQFPFWRIDWLPVNNLKDQKQGLIWTAVPIPESQAKPDGDYPVDGAESILKFVAQHIDQWGKAGPLCDNLMKGVFFMLAAFYGVDTFTGPLRNMLPVDRKAPILVAMAEWGFDPADRARVVTVISNYFLSAGWPNLPVEIELTKCDPYNMSAWNWRGLDYIIKFNFMYMTDSCPTPELKNKIWEHIEGMWKTFMLENIQFKAHWAKMNYMDPDFVSRTTAVNNFKQSIIPQFFNPYLSERIQL